MNDPIQTLVQQLRGPLSAEFLSVEAIKRGGGGYRIPMYSRDALMPFNANGTYFIGSFSRDVTLRQWSLMAFINTTNNGSNYWSIALSVGGVGTIATLTTSAVTVATGTILIDTSIAGLAYTASNAFIQIAFTKVGAPGTALIVPEVYGM
jgi:hypothetical protein